MYKNMSTKTWFVRRPVGIRGAGGGSPAGCRSQGVVKGSGRLQGKKNLLKLPNDSNISSTKIDNTIFDDLAPTKTVFYTGGDDKVNASGLRYTGFLFSSVPGISKVGYYTGSGAMTVTTGFQPRFVLIKNISQSSNRQWLILERLFTRS